MVMLHLSGFSWLLIHFLFGQFNVQYAEATWPLSTYSNIELLGLFPDKPNASASESTTLSVHSRAMFLAAMILSQQYNITVEGQFIGWQIAQTSGDTVTAVSDTCRAMSNSNIVGIVGPAFSREANIIAPFSQTIGIPTISYSATDPNLSDRNAFPAFYRTVPSDKTAAVSMADLFVRFSWTSCIVIYQNDAFGSGGADAIGEAFNNNGLVVSETLVFDILTHSFRGDLKSTLLSSSARIVLLWADTVSTSLIIQHALDNDVLGPHFLWILSTSFPLNSFNETFSQKLIGILSLEPVVGNVVDAPVNTTLLNAAYNIWQKYEPETFPGSAAHVDYYALFAFDATWSLIQSLQQLCSSDTNNWSSCFSVLNSSFCFDRRVDNGNLFLKTITATEFLGVSGQVQFSDNVTDRITGIYYVVKNVQSSSTGLNFVSVLEWSDFTNWTSSIRDNTILWPGGRSSPPTGLAGLSGVNLRIGVIEAAPFTMFTDKLGQNSTNFIGYVPDLIDLLQNLTGFTRDIILVPPNQTYDQLVQAVADGVYDMIVGDVTITAERRKIVDFSATIFDNSMSVIVRKRVPDDVDLLSYLKPFSLSLWLALLAACIYTAVLFCLLERKENPALANRSITSACSLSMWYSFGTLVGYGADFHSKTAAGRLLSGGLYILCLILVATYTANLASILTLSKSNNYISGIDDIKNGIIPFSRIGIVVGSAGEDYYLREISDDSRNFYPLTSQSDAYKSLLDNFIDASILDTGYLEYATNTIYCNLTLVGTTFATSSYGIAVNKGWVYLQALDVSILSLRASGTLASLNRKWFEGKICPDLPTSDTTTSIDIVAISGLFLIFGIIMVLSLLLFMWKKRIVLRDYLWTLLRR